MPKITTPQSKRKPSQPIINEPFVMVPVRAYSLPLTAQAVLGCLLHRQNRHGYCWPSYEEIMEFTRITSRTTISNAIKRLAKDRWIAKSRRFNNSTQYQMILVSPDNGLSESPDNGLGQSTSMDANNNQCSSINADPENKSDVLVRFLSTLEVIPFPTDGICPPSNHVGIPLDGEIMGKAKKIVSRSRNTDDLLRLTGVLAYCYGLENDPFHAAGANFSARKMSLGALLKDFANQLRLARAWSQRNQLPNNAVRHEFRDVS